MHTIPLIFTMNATTTTTTPTPLEISPLHSSNRPDFYNITLTQDCSEWDKTQFLENVRKIGGEIVIKYPLNRSFDIRLPLDGIRRLDHDSIENIQFLDDW